MAGFPLKIREEKEEKEEKEEEEKGEGEGGEGEEEETYNTNRILLFICLIIYFSAGEIKLGPHTC